MKRKKEYKEEIVSRYKRGETMEEISKDFPVCRRTIGRWLNHWNVDKRTLSRAVHLSRMNDCSLNRKQISVIEGELLGDGSLQKYKNRQHGDYYFILNSTVLGHCLLLKSELPDGLSCEKTPYEVGRKIRDSPIWSFKTRSCPDFTKLRERWYESGKKEVPKSLSLNKTSLYHWYIGDGSIRKKSNKPYYIFFSTDGFTKKSIKLLSEKLTNLGYETRIWQSSNPKTGCGLRIFLLREASIKFLNNITNKIPEYDYKWKIN